MISRLLFWVFCFILPLLTSSLKANEEDPGFVTVKLSGQFGNQLFEVAVAYAYALDHNLALTIPDLVSRGADNTLYNAKKLFLGRVNSYSLPYAPELLWTEPSFNYAPIPDAKSVELRGYFQSEKYFKHRRKELLDLFQPPAGLKEKILAKYPFLTKDTLVVGIQIRDYRREMPNGQYHPTLDRSYFKRAMKLFPKNAVFLVSSNNYAHAQECTEGVRDNVIYLNGEDYIEEFYTLSLCKSFIISNSSFGWWAAWLSQSSNKKVIAPNPWFAPPYDFKMMQKDIVPEGWVVLNHS